MPADLNTRPNIFVLIDEAHRTTGGDLGNYLMAGIPERRLHRLHRHAGGQDRLRQGDVQDLRHATTTRATCTSTRSRESIEDGTTLPLYYNLAPNEMLVPHELMEKEFWSLAETEGITDIEELNKILDRAVNLKNFLKGDERVEQGRAVRGRALPRERRAAGLQGVPRRRGPRGVRAVQGGARQVPAAGVLGSRLHRQQQRHAAAEEVAPRREDGEADPQGLRQGRRAARRS